MNKKQPKHLHIYKKKKYPSGYTVLLCTDVTCTHKIQADEAEGKLCRCYHCDQPMIIDKKALLRVKIHCPDCTKESNRSKPKLDLVGLIENRIGSD